MNEIGKNIKQLRQKNEWSQGQVAKRLNISVPAFSKIETGITDINFSRLNQIAQIFNVTVIEIISKNGNDIHSEYFEKVNSFKEKLAVKELEINKLQKKVIDLYEETREKKRR